MEETGAFALSASLCRVSPDEHHHPLLVVIFVVQNMNI